MTFQKRHIDLKFQLGEGDFGESGQNTISVSGTRVSAVMTKAGGMSMTQLDLRVYGLTLDVMNKLTILGNPLIPAVRRNIVTVSAGDDDSGMSTAFQGIIQEAWADFQGVPEASLVAKAYTGLIDQMKPATPTSFKGSVDAATVLKSICSQMTPPLSLENNGVSVQISNPYLSGTLRDQAMSIARAGDFNILIEHDVMAIWPKNGTRGGGVPVISADSDMVGYPLRTQNGVQITTLYNPNILFGGKVQVKSIEKPASGFWTPISVIHELESEIPDGKWFTRFDCSLFGKPIGIAQ